LEVHLLLFDEVKKSYYETLGVARTAGNDEIKRAYFGMVRKYQPDRSPNEFKEIRAAYETLSDKQKRSEYDAIGKLPPSVAPLFHEAQRLDHFGRNNKAAELYQTILKRHPDLDSVREQYARSLSEDDKPGKAAEVWEELCRRQPGNPLYAQELCQNYADRGWHKKALAEIQRALSLDRSSIDSWVLQISCMVMGMKHNAAIWDDLEKTSLEALEAVKNIKTDEWKKIRIYTHLFMAYGIKKVESARDSLRKMIDLVRENGRDGREEGQDALREIMITIPGTGLASLYPELSELVDLVSDTSDTFFRKRLDRIKLNFEIEGLEKKGFHEIFHDLFTIANSDFEEDYNEIEVLSIEFILLKDKKKFYPQIRRLKEEFPEIYALHSSFLDELLRGRDSEKMMRQRLKQIDRLKRQNGFYNDDLEDEDEEFAQETVRREQPKVGRNDPCPCGSGKKYKRCCGR
jgi:tetratricopeptide (TPR) repeat protein